MDLHLKGKTAIVVGGGGANIGRGISITLAEEGANVVIGDFDQGGAEKVAATINASGGKAVAIKTDAIKYSDLEALVKKTLEQFGSIDILVNVVGLGVGPPFLESKPEQWETTINLNFRTMLNACHLVLPHMVEKRSGAVVSISSDAGRMGEFRQEVYSGVKAAVIGSTKSMARAVGRYGIRLNVVCPGLTPRPQELGQERRGMPPEQLERIAHDFYPLRRLGEPQDLANAVAFLASDRAGFITGQTLSVSGGYFMP